MQVQIVDSVNCDMQTAVASVWVDRGAGFYEFAILKNGEIMEMSEEIYGNPVAALRDGLTHYLEGV